MKSSYILGAISLFFGLIALLLLVYLTNLSLKNNFKYGPWVLIGISSLSMLISAVFILLNKPDLAQVLILISFLVLIFSAVVKIWETRKLTGV